MTPFAYPAPRWNIGQRLEHDPNMAIGRLPALREAVAGEELPSPTGMSGLASATRQLVVGRVNRLSAAPARLNEGRLD